MGRGYKSYINYLGHVTKMAAMLRNAENAPESSSPEPVGRFP